MATVPGAVEERRDVLEWTGRMRLELQDIRKRTLQWLDDPSGDRFAPNGEYERLDQLINEAYQHVVNEVDRIPHAWAVSEQADATDVTTSTDTREYGLGLVRRVVEVNEARDSDEILIDVVDWNQRNRASTGVYVFRAGAVQLAANDDRFYVGMVRMPPAYSTLRVYTLPILRELAVNQAPDAVPEDFHELLVYRAAMLGKQQVNRDPAGVTRVYLETLREMTLKLAGGGPGQKMHARRFSKG